MSRARWPLAIGARYDVERSIAGQPANTCRTADRLHSLPMRWPRRYGIVRKGIRMRTREGMAVARARGKLRGKKPKLTDRQARELRRMYDTGDYSVADLAEVFSVSRPTVYRTLARQPSDP